MSLKLGSKWLQSEEMLVNGNRFAWKLQDLNIIFLNVSVSLLLLLKNLVNWQQHLFNSHINFS